MKIFILLCNILVPVVMICIGILYNKNSNRKINNILELFVPIAIISSGLNNSNNIKLFNDKNSLKSYNKKCGNIWFVLGLISLIITTIVLIINKSDILNSTTFLDTTNVSVIMLEVEFAIVIMAFISVEFILKNAFYKKINTKS